MKSSLKFVTTVAPYSITHTRLPVALNCKLRPQRFVAQVLVAELTERLVGAGGQTILKMKWTNNKRKNVGLNKTFAQCIKILFPVIYNRKW